MLTKVMAVNVIVPVNTYSLNTLDIAEKRKNLEAVRTMKVFAERVTYMYAEYQHTGQHSHLSTNYLLKATNNLLQSASLPQHFPYLFIKALQHKC